MTRGQDCPDIAEEFRSSTVCNPCPGSKYTWKHRLKLWGVPLGKLWMDSGCDARLYWSTFSLDAMEKFSSMTTLRHSQRDVGSLKT